MPEAEESKPSAVDVQLPSKDDDDFFDDDIMEGFGAGFRGVAVAVRKLLIAKAPAAKVATKQAVRAIGESRPLAFASEGAVAGDKILPRVAYYGAWGLSGAAICADIYNKQDDAPDELKFNTALYWTTFHIPASLVVPALIIHRVVHTVEQALENPKSNMLKSLPPRAKAMAPVGAALLSIIPVVPAVDYAAESIMEPTWGAYLGLSFEHHHQDHADEKGKEKEN